MVSTWLSPSAWSGWWYGASAQIPPGWEWQAGRVLWMQGSDESCVVHTHASSLELKSAEVSVEKIMGDGNCLFAASAQHLGEGLNHVAVRSKVVGYLREHSGEEFLSSLLQTAITDHNEALQHRIQEESSTLALLLQEKQIQKSAHDRQLKELSAQKIEGLGAYLERVEKEKFFGGAAEVYAIAHCYEVPIVVYEAFGGMYIPSMIVAPEASEGKSLSPLLYDSRARHYDLLVPS